MQKTSQPSINTLSVFIQEKRHQEFEWGTFDCALFAADCCRLQTNIDPALDYRGHYSTALGARRALKRYGDGTLVSAFDKHFSRINKNYAMRGDIALFKENGQESVGLVWSNGILATGEKGLVMIALERAQIIWSVNVCRPS